MIGRQRIQANPGPRPTQFFSPYATSSPLAPRLFHFVHFFSTAIPPLTQRSMWTNQNFNFVPNTRPINAPPHSFDYPHPPPVSPYPHAIFFDVTLVHMLFPIVLMHHMPHSLSLLSFQFSFGPSTDSPSLDPFHVYENDSDPLLDLEPILHFRGFLACSFQIPIDTCVYIYSPFFIFHSK